MACSRIRAVDRCLELLEYRNYIHWYALGVLVIIFVHCFQEGMI